MQKIDTEHLEPHALQAVQQKMDAMAKRRMDNLDVIELSQEYIEKFDQNDVDKLYSNLDLKCKQVYEIND